MFSSIAQSSPAAPQLHTPLHVVSLEASVSMQMQTLCISSTLRI